MGKGKGSYHRQDIGETGGHQKQTDQEQDMVITAKDVIRTQSAKAIKCLP